MLSCVCPHIGEELWSILGHSDTIAYEPWPIYDVAKTIDDSIEMPVQINGKVRSVIAVPNDADKDTILSIVKADEKISQALDGKSIVKEIVIPGKIINIVVK
jgi:leucyl-tRNA synthetase